METIYPILGALADSAEIIVFLIAIGIVLRRYIP